MSPCAMRQRACIHCRMRCTCPWSGLIEPSGLFVLSRKCSNDREPVDTRGLSLGCGFQEVTLVASVPLSIQPIPRSFDANIAHQGNDHRMGRSGVRIRGRSYFPDFFATSRKNDKCCDQLRQVQRASRRCTDTPRVRWA